MARVVIIGNAGGGKSTLARAAGMRRGLRHVEIDRWLWREDWIPVPADAYEADHAALIAGDDWVIDGLGRRGSIADRIGRATDIVLVDMPLWMHYWLAAERQIAWVRGTLAHPPAGFAAMPPTRALFETMWKVDRDWMPEIRSLCVSVEAHGVSVTRLVDVADLDRFAAEA